MNCHNHKINKWPLKENDPVLKNMKATRKKAIQGKLTPSWEGPYTIIQEVFPETFRLAPLKGDNVPGLSTQTTSRGITYDVDEGSLGSWSLKEANFNVTYWLYVRLAPNFIPYEFQLMLASFYLFLDCLLSSFGGKMG